MENAVADKKSQINTSDKNSNNKNKDIEDAIQKAIDTETMRNESIGKSFKRYKTK
jgi:hypothetical protein